MKKILLVSDMPGVGKVALAGMIPILSAMDVDLCNLPTALVSNNFAHGAAEIYDLTDYMDKAQKIWEKHGFEFDIITTGIIMNERQVDIIENIINAQEKRPLVITDPIMGDGGKIYAGLPEDIINAMRKVIPLADILVPNSTEAALILGEKYPEGPIKREEVERWIHKLVEKGAKSVIITSIKTEEGHLVYGYDGDNKKMFDIEYEHYPVTFGGTGDIFTSLLTGKLGEGYSVEDSARYAVKILNNILRKEAERGLDVIIEVPVEKYLKGLDHLDF